MSDKELMKTEKYLRKLNIHAATSRAVRFPTKKGGEYTLHQLMQSYADQEKEPETVIMKFKDAPVGARFHFIGDGTPKDIYVKINTHGNGLIVKWNGNVQGYQSHYCWVDEENGYDFDTEIEVI